MATDLEDILPDVLTHAPDCPEPLAFRYIRETARELCKTARNWRVMDEFTITTPDCEGLCTVQDASIHEIQWAELDGHELAPRTVAWLDENRPRWQSQDDVADSARYVTQLTPNAVTVVPKASGLLNVRYVLIPSIRAQTLPDFLVEQYAEIIGKGAAGRVLITPSLDFANPQLGLSLISEFKSLLTTLKWQGAKGQQGSRLRTTGSYF